MSITQVVDENGSEQDIISTGLLIVDEHQQRVAITDIVSNTGQLSQYSIYATMKVSVTNDRQALKVRINWFETTLNYGTSMKASSLMQTSKYSPEVGFQYDDITKTISNPAGGTPYHYTPNNTQMITYSTLECGRSCRSYIKAGTSSLNIAYCVISSAREAAGRELKQNSIIRTSELIENRRSPCVIDTRGAFFENCASHSRYFSLQIKSQY